MSYRKLLSCFYSLTSESNAQEQPLQRHRQQKQQQKQKHQPDEHPPKSSRQRPKQRQRCPKCHGYLSEDRLRRKAAAAAADAGLTQQLTLPPVIIPVRLIRNANLANSDFKEDSGCYDQKPRASIQPPLQQPRIEEDSGVGGLSYSDSLTVPRLPMNRSNAPQPSASSSDSLMAQLNQQTKYVPRLPNRRAPFDAESQQRFLAVKELALSSS